MEISRVQIVLIITALSALAAFCGWMAGTSHGKGKCDRLLTVSREVLRSDPGTYASEPLNMNGFFYSRLDDAIGECDT